MSFLKRIFGINSKVVNTSVASNSVWRRSADRDPMNTEMGKLLVTIGEEILGVRKEKNRYNYLAPDSKTYMELKKNPEKAIAMARFIFENRTKAIQPVESCSCWFSLQRSAFAVFTGLMRSNLPIEPEELLMWMGKLHDDENNPKHDIYTKREFFLGEFHLEKWSLSQMIQMIERQAEKKPLSEKETTMLQAMLSWDEMSKKGYNSGTDFAKLKMRIENLLAKEGASNDLTNLYKKLSGDEFGEQLQDQLKGLEKEEATKWHRAFNLAASANGSKPGKLFVSSVKELKENLGKEWVRSHLQDWLAQAISAKMIESTRRTTYHTWTENIVFTPSNAALLKGLVWICDGFQDSKTVNLVADLCEKSMKKIPGVGPAAQAIANACLWYLENTPGVEATARLARLSTAIKQKGIQKKVAEIIKQKAETAGVTTIQLEERVVPTYGLMLGEKSVAFDDYTLKITVENVGSVNQTWLKPGGEVQKTKPKFVLEKAAHKAKFDKIKDEITNLKKVLTAQRDRIDRLFAEDLEWPLGEIESNYVCHDLLCVIAQRLIWSLQTGGATTAALWQNGAWQDITGKKIATTSETKVRLWHPIDCETDQVMAWRARLSELELVQPTKQAWREVYVLTDAERNTRVYSNRMAAHMVKQHQMATLMAARGWRYQLMGSYDDGLDDQWAIKSYVTSDLSAEYLLHTNWDQENWNEAGIYLYVGTDQLRFVRQGTPVDLESVPPRIFSEAMREADLFVGVASVGNDPVWADQGPTPESRNYWQCYSFGNLDGFAETRKQVLEQLLPRLKIRNVAHIEGKFLIVDGKLNTYKIHLGSSNILMAPGDRYLCIVPGGVSKATKLALPFEGDSRLSVILSKAFMLAEDDKITDSSIKSQLGRGR